MMNKQEEGRWRDWSYGGRWWGQKTWACE